MSYKLRVISMFVQNIINVPQWYAVQVSDTTMMPWKT